MSVDINFWKYQNGIYLDNAIVYKNACCDNEPVEGLSLLPIEDILKEIAAAFPEWTSPDPFHYENQEHGAFEISTTPQSVRFDCYSMNQADIKRFSSIMSKFECPLYDPQQSVRFDKIVLLLVDETGSYKAQTKQEFSRLLPRLEFITRVVTWEEYVRLSKTLNHIHYNAVIHRAKTLTKITSFMQFGNAWANRSCQCKTDLLTDPNNASQLLEKLLSKSIGSVLKDFLDRTYYA